MFVSVCVCVRDNIRSVSSSSRSVAVSRKRLRLRLPVPAGCAREQGIDGWESVQRSQRSSVATAPSDGGAAIAAQPFIPTSGRDPSAGSDSSSPTGCNGRNCCSSSRSNGGHSCHRAGCTPSGRPGSARIAWKHPAAACCPVNCLPLNFYRCLRCHRLAGSGSAPPSRRSSCWHPGRSPRT